MGERVREMWLGTKARWWMYGGEQGKENKKKWEFFFVSLLLETLLFLP